MAQINSPRETTSSTVTTPADEDDALRKRLLSRIAVAGVVILGLLGGLAVFDSLNKPEAPALPKMAATPAEPADSTEEGKLAESKPEEAKTEDAKIAEAETPSVPERTETPLAPPPLDKPGRAAKALTPPAIARPAAVRPDARQEIAKVIPEQTRAAHAPASRPLAPVTDAARRFLVQVGVFSNHANAEELLTKLQQAGIPAQIESRVQAGPFASKAEADVTRAKLKAFGIDDGLLVRR